MSPAPVPNLRLFELEAEGRDVFVGSGGHRARRLFGGLVAAQAALAAGRTVDPGEPRHLHSLHAYFLRPGQGGVPVRYVVQRLKEGRAFAARAVSAFQGEELIFSLHASFTLPEPGIAHQEARMPEVPDPETLEELLPRTMRPDADGRRSPAAERFLRGPVEMRSADPEPNGRSDTSLRRIWIRPRRPLPENPLLHAAVLVWTSDRSLIRTGARLHDLSQPGTRASLDHAMWFHQPARFEDWLLFVMESPVAHSARAWVRAAMYRPDGARVVSIVQECLIRGT